MVALRGIWDNKGQMKIMQMIFMILAVFFFFILVGLFVLTIALKDLKGGADDMSRAQAISSLEIIAAMPELNYNDKYSLTVDEDKLRVLSGGIGDDYEVFWPIASLEVHSVYPMFDEFIECPAANCNYYNIYDSGQQDTEKFSSYVSICKRVKEFGTAYDKCSIGKLSVGVKKFEEVNDEFG